MKLYKIGYTDCECGSIDIILTNKKEYTEEQLNDLIKDIFTRVGIEREHLELTIEMAMDDIIDILITEFGFNEQLIDGGICRYEWSDNYKTLKNIR